ncbi:putative Ig domain-containing protein [uncultured Sphingomonas sp.]|uniref:putative Ig domain-containing protein n=1 Tax=uncultured Sphingomonas sp. TaxID=158754 RepID=UPI003748CB05
MLPLIALSALAVAAMPCAAAAESAACAAINNGELNYSANFSSTAAPSPKGRTAGASATASGIRSASYTSTTGNYPASYAGFSPTLYDFDANERITFTVQTIGVSGSSFRAFFPISNTTPGSAVSAPGILLASAGTITETLTTDAGTNAVLARIQRGSTTDTGSFTMSATCVGTPPPAISSIAPTSGPTGGGTSVTINGSNFTGVDQVRFDSTLVSVTPASDTQIIATAPAHAAGTVGIAVVKNGTASATFTGFTYVAAPAVTAVAPNSGGAGGGNSVTVTGTGFTNATAVNFGATSASSFTVNSATQITATAPAGSGTVNVTVTSPGGTSATGAGNQYRYVAAPTISAISPTGGSSGGGTPVTITGTDFVNGNTYSVSFGATTVPATYASATTLTATTPAGTGTATVGVTDTTTGQASTGSVNYTFAAPTVTALSVTSGPANAPRTVTITGTNFTPTATVSIGGTAATGVSYTSATQLSATLPAKAAGTYDVQVTTGSVTSATGPASQYSYIAAPTVTSATPNSGSTTGGTSVTITGTALTGASAVTFGGNAATSFTVTGDTQITATTPAGSAGAVAVAVTTPGGTATLAGGYSYVVLNPPAVTTQPVSQTVAVGATASFTASASGSPSPSVQWQVSSDSGASFTNVAGATAATYTSPATTAGDNGRQYRAVFTNSQGSATSSAATLTVIQAPTANARSVTATFNTATAVTLTGSDPNTPARTLAYNVATAPAHGTLSGTAPNLTFTPSLNYIGTDSFTFTVSNGLATSSAATVTITVAGPPAPAAPVLTSPANGSTLNTATPTVTGVTASGTTVEVFIDGTLSGNATVSGGNFTYTVASALGQGSHTVYAVASASGVASPASNTNAFTIDTVAPAAPVITAPANGATLANRRPAITGTAESNASLAIRINGAAAGTTSATAGGTYSYTPAADLPLGPNTVSVTATDAAGNASAPATSSFTIVALPTVSAVTPAEGSTAGGTTITVTGTNFTSGSTVTVGGTPATGVTIASATSLTAVTPAGTAGAATVQVTNMAGVSTTNGSFTYIGAPTASAQAVSTAFQTARSIVLAGTDPNTPARTLSYAITAAPARGTLSGTAPNLTYTPAAGVRGTDSFTFTASNGVSISAPATVTVTIGDPMLTIAPPPASGTVGTAYTATLTTTGGTAPYSYAVTAGTLPTGLTLATGGTLSGTPTSAGSFAFTVTAEDSTGGNPPVRQAQAFTITIGRGAQTVRFTSTPPAGAIVGGTYLVAASASSGLTPVIAIDAGSRAACSITGNSVRFDQVGTCVVTANQAGDMRFDPATPVQQSIAIGAPTIALSPATVPTPQVGTAYSQRFTASGGTAPYSFAVTAGALPTGLTLASDGTLSGTPSAAGSFAYTIAATDSASGSGAPFVGQASYTTSVQPPVLTLSPAANTATATALPAATGGTAYSQTITTSGGIAPYSYSIVSGALPAGLTLASGGVISGTPSAAGTFTFRLRATDSATTPFGVEGLYAITVGAPAIVVTPATLSSATVGQAYDQTVTASGAGTSYSYAVTAGALPSGVTLASDGRLTGTPGAGGSFTFTLTATNAAGFTGARAYTLSIAAPTLALSPASLPAGTSGVAYSATLSASGGIAPYNFAVTAGALPAGVTLSSSGVLTGTAIQSGSFTFSVTATDNSNGSGPYSATRSYTLVIGAPALTLVPATLANATVGVAYSQTLIANGGTAPYSYAVSAGALPAGVTLGANGTLSGTPTAGGSYNFTVTATDTTTTANGGPYTAARSYTLTVASATVALNPANLPAGTSGAAYSEALSATSGTAPYSYAVTTGALPAGVTLSSSGVLAGTPTQSGSFTFTVTATDSSTGSGPYSATRSYTLVIAAPALALAPATLVNATVGATYNQALIASGGAAPYSYTITAGALPAGVTLGTNGTLSGMPTAGGSYSFTVTATDATTIANGGPYTAVRSYTLMVTTATVAFAQANVPAGVSGAPYSETLSATGGTAPYTFAVTAGALPAGVTLSGSGALAGTPMQSGSFTFSVTATDSSTGSGPYSATRSYTLVIGAPALTLAPATLGNATVGAAYSQALIASGGTAPYNYAVTAGALPAGVMLGTNGTLSGTPTAGGSYSFTVTATDATTSANGGPYTAVRSYTLTVASATVALSPANLPAGTSGTAYSETLSATGGTVPYVYTVTAGALPAGVTLASNGTLAGTPTQSGSFTFSVTATDSSTGSGPYRATRSYTLSIAAPALALDPATLANATVGSAYSQALTARGGTAPYSYAVTNGALPAGVTLGTNGTLSGTPTAGGSYSFTVTATDATAPTNGGPYTASRSYTLSVATATVAFGQASLPAGVSGAAFSETLSATGGTAPYSYSLTAGALPAGLTLASNGTLAGTPTQSGNFTFSITATDSSTGSGPYSATRSYTLSIAAPALALDPATLVNATVGAAYSRALTATGGTAPYSYAVTAGTLPAGVTLGTNGTLSGTPTAGGSYGFTVTATDTTATANGGPYTAVRSYTLVVSAASVAVGPASLPDGRYEAAYTQTLSASGGTAPYRYAVTDGALPAGVTLAADGTLSGTPSAFGRFAFTVTATDSSTGAGPYSGAKAYSLIIAPPDVPVAVNVTLAVGYGAAATAVPLKINGGEATSVAIATAPTHGTATVKGTAISYTPAVGYAGADSFTYTASNAGGSSAPATVSITVAQPSLALTPATLPAGQEKVAYSQQLTTSGGTAPYTYAVTAGRLPTGVTLSGGGLLAGTPQESGRYTVTVTATDSSSGNGPFTAANAYTLDIALPAPPVARPGSAATNTTTTTQNGSVAIDLSALVTGDYRQIRITAQPQHGTVSIDARQQAVTETNQRVSATYTPEPGYIGEDSFGYVAIGNGGTSNEARVAITVKGSAPVAPAIKASVTNGQTQIVDLTEGAIGGPFTAATIVSVTPADGVEATLVESGSTGDRRYQLRITPRGRFSGSATVAYTLTNAYGTSAPAAVSVSVVQRADPSQDATVTGISAAQAEATRRFAQAQLDNFQRRNEQLHNGGGGSVGRPMGISIAGGNSYGGRDPNAGMAATDLAMLKSDHATEVMGRERAAGLTTYDRDGRAMPMTGLAGARSDRAMSQATPGDPAARARNGEPEAIEGSGRPVGSTAIWSGGAIALGTEDATRGRGKLTVSTGGLSSGVDVKLSETLTVGIGGGYGGERAKVGQDKGRVDSNSWMGAVYGSLAPADGLFLDGVAGAGRLSFDTIRNVMGSEAVARGHRSGSMLFGSLAGGFDRTSGTHALSAYGRIDYLSADLDRYTETGAGNANLVFDGRRLSSLSSVLGLRGSFVTGPFVPRVRAEWRHEFKNGSAQALDYADLGGFSYAIRGDGWARDNYSMELGTDYVFDNGWRIGFELGGVLGQGSRYATERITIRKQF